MNLYQTEVPAIMEHKFIDSIVFDGGINKDSYLSTLPVVKYLDENKHFDFNSQVTLFAGENGAGKSTLIEAIAVCAGFNAEGGSKNFNFSTRYTTSELCEHITVHKSAFPKFGYFYRAESFYNVATNIDDIEVGGYGYRSLHAQSHGESFLSLVSNRFQPKGLYILDEPESALSPLNQMTFLAQMKNLADEGSQFIIATHSPILLAYPGAVIYEIGENGITPTDYDNSEHVRLYRRFLQSPDRMLKYLFEE